jgi:hypothetical protein
MRHVILQSEQRQRCGRNVSTEKDAEHIRGAEVPSTVPATPVEEQTLAFVDASDAVGLDCQ